MRLSHARAALASPLLAMVAPAPALAMPPPPPPIHARYGPLTQCLAGYAIAAGADEAIVAMEDGIAVVGDRDSLQLAIDRGYSDRAQAPATMIEIAALGSVTRYALVHRGSPPDQQFEYLLPARFGGRPVLAASRQFDGGDRDLALLGRISRVDPQGGSCGAFAAPDFAGEAAAASYWRPATAPGPAYHCQNGIGYEVRAGEALQLQWRTLAAVMIPASRLLSGGVRLTVEGPVTRRDATTSVPLSRYRRSIDLWSGNRLILALLPPQEAMSHAARMRLLAEQRYTDGILIEFPFRGEAAARAFATRLEFVDRADPRCLSD